jgi:hypothetical protein
MPTPGRGRRHAPSKSSSRLDRRPYLARTVAVSAFPQPPPGSFAAGVYYARSEAGVPGGVPEVDAHGKVTALMDRLLPGEAGGAWIKWLRG